MTEELNDTIGVEEYSQGMQELAALSEGLAQTAVRKRVKKEIRQLIERKAKVRGCRKNCVSVLRRREENEMSKREAKPFSDEQIDE